MRRWCMALLLVAFVVTLFAGCTDEQLEGTKKGAGVVGDNARKVAPWLPPPFDLIAYAIGGVGSATAAVIALKQKRRATEAAQIAVLEREAKNAVTKGVRAFCDGVDRLKASDDPKIKEKVDAFLEEWKKFKARVDPYTKDALLLIDSVRKAPMPR